jgi:epoxyqueuosine reductase
MTERLNELHRRIEEQLGHPIRGKAYVDTGPMLERDLARRAGLGWFGKNTNLLNPSLGSFFFLGSLLLDLEIESDPPFDTDHCGTCTRCIQACPTGAIVEARVVDATRCLSYTTIELRGPIPEEFRVAQADLLYGCDICQDVCPWNVKFSRDATEPGFAPRAAIADKDARALARDLLAMSQETFSVDFRNSPMKRAKLRGLKRNAAVVLGNVGSPEDVELLTRALNDDEPLVREHAAWALTRLAELRADEPFFR